MHWRWLVWVFAATACASPNAVMCGDAVCPPGATCGPNNECVPAGCGDGAIAGTEECDGALEVDCTDFGFYEPDGLACSPVCTVDTAACVGSCGDHERNGPETCDGVPPVERGCADFGFGVGPLSCSSGCTPGFGLCAPIGWHIVPATAPHELRGVWGFDRTHAFAVGLGGTIMASTASGWESIASPTTKDLYGVIGSGPERAIAVGAGGTIVRWDGAAWTTMTSPVSTDLRAVAGTGLNNIIAVGAGGVIIRFDGSSWTTMPSGTTENLNAVWVGPSTAFAVGNNGTALQLVGGTWTPVTSAPFVGRELRGVFAAGGKVFVVGGGRQLLYFDGQTWTVETLPYSLPLLTDFFAISGSAADDVFVVGTGGYILHWNGSGLVEQASGTGRTLRGVFAVGSARAVAVTDGGNVLEYEGTDLRTESPTTSALYTTWVEDGRVFVAGYADDGLSAPTPDALLDDGGGWQTLTFSGGPANPRIIASWGTQGTGFDAYALSAGGGVWRSGALGNLNHLSNIGGLVASIYGADNPFHLVAVGAKVHQSNNALTWSEDMTAVNGTRALFGVWGAADDSAWFAVGAGGFIMRKTSTTPWTALDSGTTRDLRGVWAVSATEAFAVGKQGTALYFDGTSWRTLYTGTTEDLVSVAGTSASDVFAGGTGGVRLHYDGVAWSRLPTATFDIEDVAASPELVVFAGNAGTIGTVDRLVRVTGEELCRDRWDNDGDGLVNCADPDCASDVTCQHGGSCETTTRIDCETTVVTSSFSGIARLDDLRCLGESTPGPEAVFRFVPPVSGTVTISIDEPMHALSLAVTDALSTGGCDLTSCTAGTPTATGASVSFSATADAGYYVIVDGPLSQGYGFTLSVSCP